MDGGGIAAWQGGAAHGPAALSFHESAANDTRGTTHHERSVLVGIRIPYRRVAWSLQAGLGAVSQCKGSIEQSLCTQTMSARHVPIYAAGVDALVTSYMGLHSSYFHVSTPDIGYHALVVGVIVGKLR